MQKIQENSLTILYLNKKLGQRVLQYIISVNDMSLKKYCQFQNFALWLVYNIKGFTLKFFELSFNRYKLSTVIYGHLSTV